MKSILIRDTTIKEREEIVHRSLSACGASCSDCSGGYNRDGGIADTIYLPYIEGKMEISEINDKYRREIVRYL